MTSFKLIQTEKSYRLQEKNIYTIVFDDPNFQPNKIEASKILKQNGYTPIEITIVNPPKKRKARGSKRNVYFTKRPKKYYVKLKPGESIKNQEEQTS